MSLKPLNSVGGFSVGASTLTTIIDANGNVTTSQLKVANGYANLGNVANVYIGGGTNGYLLSTDGNGNLTWSATASTNLIFNGNSNVSIPTANGNIYLNANAGVDKQWVFDTTGNTTFPSNGVADLGNFVVANYANFRNDLVVQGNIANANNVSITNNLEGNTANFSGNITSLNANLGNLVTANYANFANGANVGGNLAISNSSPTNGILTDNLYYSNGSPWDLQEAAGANTQVQYNDGNNNFGASSAFTFDYAGNVLTVTGNAQFNNANLGNLATANFANFSNDLVVQGNIANANNISVTNNITSDTSSVTGNLTAGNVDGGNLVKANNFSTNGSGGDLTLSGGNIQGANVVLANSFTSNGGVVDFNTNNANVQLGSNANVYLYGGSTGQVLQTDGAGNLNWYSISASEIVNGNSNVTIPDVDGNVYINANAGTDRQWNFDTTGFLTTPFGGQIVDQYKYTGDPTGQLMLSNAASGYSNGLAGLNQGAGNNTVYLTDLGFEIYTNTYGVENYWHFDGSGNFTAGEGASAGTTTLGNLVTANFANFTNDLVVQGNIANANNISVTYNISSDTANVTGNLTAGNANLGNLATANNFSTNGSGGDVTLTGGNVTGANVVLANSFTSNGGVVDFSTNNANVQLGDIPNVHILGGTSGYVLQTDGTGNLSWVATGTQSQIFNGYSNVTIPTSNGSVYINANASVDQQWDFNPDGNLTTPGNIQLGGSSIVDNNGSGIELYSACNYAQLNYNNASYVYVQSDGVWLEVNAGTLQLDTTGNVIISQNLEVQGNIANANNISATNNISAGSANITNDLVVQGNIANANNISVTNKITAGSANVTNDLDVGGNIVTGTGSGGNISGVNYLTANVINTGKIANGTSNVRIDQDGNITLSSNNLSNVFTFTYQGANVVGYIEANGIISAGGFVGSNLVSNVGILSLQAKQTGGNYNINLLAGGNGNVDVGTTYITSVKDPLNPQDAATKYYVDLVAQGLHVHAPANLATSTDLANTLGIPAGNVVYNQPGPEGVGATLTFTGNSLTLLDSVAVTANMRLLIKNEANAVWNGVYLIGSNAFFITRTTDEDQNADFAGGDFLFVESGTQYADTGWVQTTDNVVIGTSNIVFSQFSGAGSYYGANGILVSGTEISANVDNVTTAIIGGNIAVKANAQLTTPNIGAATGTSLDLTGNVLAGNLNSNATITTVDLNATGNIIAANLTSNAFITAVDGNLTGNLTVGGNITTTGASGNISGANVVFANSFTSNGGTIDFATNNPNVNLGDVANVHVLGGSAGQVLVTDGAGNLSFTSNANISTIQNGTSNVTIPSTNGNVYINAGGSSQWNFDTSGNLTGPATGSANLGNAVTANYGNFNTILTAPNVTANTSVVIGTTGSLSTITTGNVTTTSIAANQTIATFSAVGVTGVEYLVKSIDENGVLNKYSVSTLLAVTDGANVDYSIYGTSQIGGYTGGLTVNISGSNIELQVTPASSNSTVWTTQYRLI